MCVLRNTPIDVGQYVETARRKAIAGISHDLDLYRGSLIGAETHEDENGYWLSVRATWSHLPDVEVRFSRLVLHVDGPDKDAETEGIIYGSAFIELLLTRAVNKSPVDGVITL
jgi:hypothetical protein